MYIYHEFNGITLPQKREKYFQPGGFYMQSRKIIKNCVTNDLHPLARRFAIWHLLANFIRTILQLGFSEVELTN